MRRTAILMAMMAWSGVALSAEVVDAAGRTVQVPDHVAHVVPAGPPAAILLEAPAPDLLTGWPSPLSADARALLSPDVAKLPFIPRVTGREDVSEQIKALKPDLIVDYGTVLPRYADLAQATQQRTGIPTILLDGALPKIPDTFRKLGALLHREARAEALASFAEALLALPMNSTHPRVLYARGTDGLMAAASNTDVTEVFSRLGWNVVAPDGQGTFRTSNIEAIRALDLDVLIFSDPAMRDVIGQSEAWKTMRGGAAGACPGLAKPAVWMG